MSEKVAEVARLGAAGGLGQARGRGVVPVIGEAGVEEGERGGLFHPAPPSPAASSRFFDLVLFRNEKRSLSPEMDGTGMRRNFCLWWAWAG